MTLLLDTHQTVRTVSVGIVKALFYPASKLGITREELLAEVGLSEKELDDPETRVPCHYKAKLIHAIVEMSGDDSAPVFLAQHILPTDFNVFGYIMLNAPTLRAVYEKCLRYQRLIGDGMNITFEERQDYGHCIVDIIDPVIRPYQRYLMEYHFATHVTFQRKLVARQVKPYAIHFVHEKPYDFAKQRSFFGCDVFFGAERYELVMPKSLLDESVTNANPQFFEVFQQMADQILSEVSSTNNVSRIVSRHLLALIPENRATLDEVALKLAMGPRTLQRKLKDEGFSFNELLSKIRKELAVQHLQKGQLSISEISYLLGFAEPSVFHRSFKKWTGKTPKDFRKSISGNGKIAAVSLVGA
jgi:AraC-like DNA-binding protein